MTAALNVNRKITSLNLSSNSITSAGAVKLSLFMYGATRTLVSPHLASLSSPLLPLVYPVFLTTRFAARVKQALSFDHLARACCVSVCGVMFISLPSVLHSSRCALTDRSSEPFNSLKQLDLASNLITDEGIIALAAAVSHNPHFEQVRVRYSTEREK